MILDRLDNAGLYRGIHPRIAAAVDWLRSTDVTALPLGRTVIEGTQLFALVQQYTPRPAAELKFEAHERYWDVQLVARGTEQMGWGPRSQMTVIEPYDNERDVAFFRGPGQFVLVPAGSFAIFAPSDVHMPGVAAEPLSPVWKVVLKVEVAG